jgi:hypothetical protein
MVLEILSDVKRPAAARDKPPGRMSPLISHEGELTMTGKKKITSVDVALALPEWTGTSVRVTRDDGVTRDYYPSDRVLGLVEAIVNQEGRGLRISLQGNSISVTADAKQVRGKG